MAGNNSDGEMMSEINVTPLVDVMLVLLVVFIITAPLLSPQSLKITLPKTDAVQQTEKLQKVSLEVDARGNVAMDHAHVSDAGLSEALRVRAMDPAFQLQIEADKLVPYGRIAELMALAQHAGVSKLSFVTLAK
ncbi:ExbD/TolR family protein [Gallionella capsiferriformans]|jgi:biopolymer transport protein ExbD|uniref:Biopolymer transport protein ExbD/TolR n=1 Tax=Gallionella capsiferriformans (strain ES-2) TaxID=395494 RepID=D9SGW4_GALCS|nr:biopolymer transporter ExbD [Gallionella capsiferriformans]ADL55761.1 Biopolymer transport protein ExbD/TolR [Gallionella capsiferriformans ES-2]